MATLFDITAEQRRINDALMESGGELTPELEEALLVNAENFAVKVEGYATSIRKFDALAEAADAEIKRIQAIKKAANNSAKRLKESLAYGMEVMGMDKAEIGLNKLSFRSSTAVNITDEVRIPSQYIKVETSIDKMALKKDLQAGLIIEGAELVTNRNLQIR